LDNLPKVGEVLKKTVRVFTNYETSSAEFSENFPNSSLEQSEYELHLNESGPADMALVLGHARPSMWVQDCPLGIYKLIQDPPQPGLFGRFTRYAPAWADETLTPFPAATYPKRLISKHPAIYNWHLGISFDEVVSLDVSNKTGDISCIASTKQDLPGHTKRFEFVQQIEQSEFTIDVFGRGRARQLPHGKLDGLLPYRYSIAIENTVHDHYFTEKIMDCWLAGTVPIYFGAQDLEKYFPRDSFIRLNELDYEDFAKRVKAGEFSREEFERRKIAVSMAKEVVIEKFSMHALISSVLARGQRNEPFQHSGRVLVSDLDSYCHSFRDWAASKVKRA
jgi:hypothetical protein